ncbi:hypothetical protein [Qipengyuania flava]|uniref:hypothetical protein n=1 Tax=Qipengyuania flava TaxID=192812 RepID=UPI001C62E661|nr:hypothetical protein [Qipengyuania flava]QYJ06619.1 hypothetical protein KUV82_11170 [Qipengyuania flava]
MRALAALALLLAGCAGEGPAPEEATSTEPAEEIAAAGEDAPDTRVTQAPAPSPVTCSQAEEAIFSCKTASGKSIAVCGTPDGKAEYRFGGDTAELTLRGGEWASVPYSGGGEAQIAFANGPVRYVVFSRMIRTNFAAGEPNNPVFSDGVIVLEGEEVVALQTCDDPDTLAIQYFAAEERFPTADDLFTFETGRADPATAE